MRASGTAGLVVAGVVLAAAVGLFGWIAAQGPRQTAQLPAAPGDTNLMPSGVGATDSPPARNVVADARYGYQVSVPEGWKVTDHTRGAQLIRADLSSGDTGVQIRVMSDVGETTASAFLTGYLDRFVREMEAHWGGRIDELTRDCIVTAGHSSCHVGLAHHRAKGPPWFLKQYVWVRGDTAIVLQGGALLDQRGEQEPILDAIAASLVFE